MGWSPEARRAAAEARRRKHLLHRTDSEKLADSYKSGFTYIGALGGGNSASSVQHVRFNDDGSEGVVKEEPVYEGRDPHLNEQHAALVAEALGIPYSGVHRASENTLVTRYKPGIPGWKYYDKHGIDIDEQGKLNGGQQIALLDWLIDNKDRDSRNWQVDGNHVYPVDQGLGGFSPTRYKSGEKRDFGKQRELVPDNPFTRHWLGVKTNRFGELSSIKPLISKLELQDIEKRLQKLDGVLPADRYSEMMKRLDLLLAKAK